MSWRGFPRTLQAFQVLCRTGDYIRPETAKAELELCHGPLACLSIDLQRSNIAFRIDRGIPNLQWEIAQPAKSVHVFQRVALCVADLQTHCGRDAEALQHSEAMLPHLKS